MLDELARHPTYAMFTGSTFTLSPRDEAMIPVIWNNLPKTVEEDEQGGVDSFFCMESSMNESAFAVLPGVCGNEPEGMIAIANTSHNDIVVEKGEVVASGMEIPRGTALKRRGDEGEVVHWVRSGRSVSSLSAVPEDRERCQAIFAARSSGSVGSDSV